MVENELIVVEKLNPIDLFTGNAMDPVLAQIREIVEKHAPDISTAKGRGEIASLARRVASSKVILDDLGKNLVADWKEKAKKVDIVRKNMRDELDALRDRAREPLTRWEEEEIAKLKQQEVDRQYDADWVEAYSECDLRERERIVREKEAEIIRQEEEKRRQVETERVERERKDREERIAREAADRARCEADAAITREKARAEQADRDRIAAQARAEAEKEAAVRDAERRAREEADRKERERLAAEKAERDKQEKLAANRNHRLKVEHDAIDSASDEGLPDPETWVKAISEGKVKNVTINY